MEETMVATTVALPIFEFLSNRLCLDFTNTVKDSTSARELPGNYEELVSWSQQAGILSSEETERLLDKAVRCPAEAAMAFQRAVVLRETLFRIFSRIAKDQGVEESDMDILNTMLAETMLHARLVPKGKCCEWSWMAQHDVLDRMLWPVIRSAADLLTYEELWSVKTCASDDCNWLFLDTSKNQSRRWCAMKDCGNRAKVRRHYERKKQS
jgi:predicted RNA-binding Zn ribbon-like protein